LICLSTLKELQQTICKIIEKLLDETVVDGGALKVITGWVEENNQEWLE